ncbi:MAG: tRNA pseudouridine(13) synthase TruD [Methanoregulaceae archaeon]|nr:tRNA pseudouridine(13) synthase TruD [Methanoregulaceae archaeon]
MMRSPWPLESTLGMRYYGTGTPGIGGRLRTSPGDFIVEELPLEHGGEGPYLICRLGKTNWELQHAVKEIAKRLGISHRRIGWSGTKDRNAVTTQLISLYRVTPDQIEAVRIKDLTLEVVGRSNVPLTLGSLRGNLFAIVIRETDCGGNDLDSLVRETGEGVCGGIPNYFGVQRFGAVRPVTHLVGHAILRGDLMNAVDIYCGMSFPDEPEEVRQARTAFAESGDPAAALRMFPTRLSYERALLHHLVSHPGDAEGALRALPPKLLSMFVSAVQSQFFNEALSRRIDGGAGLAEPCPGDLLLFSDGKTDRVTEANAGAAAALIARGRCAIALFMPGSGPAPVGDAMASLLDEHGIGPEDFEKASRFIGTRFNGAARAISLRTSIRAETGVRTVGLRFSLSPGCYATTVCREFMKSDPLRLV